MFDKQEDHEDSIVSIDMGQLQDHYDFSQISLHVMLGKKIQKHLNLKINFIIDLTILVDAGSTYNFIQGVAKFLGLQYHLHSNSMLWLAMANNLISKQCLGSGIRTPYLKSW